MNASLGSAVSSVGVAAGLGVGLLVGFGVSRVGVGVAVGVGGSGVAVGGRGVAVSVGGKGETVGGGVSVATMTSSGSTAAPRQAVRIKVTRIRSVVMGFISDTPSVLACRVFSAVRGLCLATALVNHHTFRRADEAVDTCLSHDYLHFKTRYRVSARLVVKRGQPRREFTLLPHNKRQISVSADIRLSIGAVVECFQFSGSCVNSGRTIQGNETSGRWRHLYYF
jgi:hypothetical protein